MKLFYSCMERLRVHLINDTSLFLSISPAITGHKLVNVRQAFLLPLFCFIMLSYALAQPPKKKVIARQFTLRPLQLGDTIPEELWHLPLQIVNNPDKKHTVTLNEYRGKLIILDFWATWCGNCIKAMPKIHDLQKQFSEDLTVLPITYEPKDKITEFIKRNEILSGLNLQSIVDDTLTKIIFPHKLIPHYIWISPNGVFLASTSSSELTQPNIQAGIEQNLYEVTNKIDLNGDLPLFLSKSVSIDSNSYFSVFMKGYYPGLPTGNRFRRIDNILRGRAVTNSELLPIYESAISPLLSGKGIAYNRKLLVLEVQDTSQVMVSLSSQKGLKEGIRYNYDIIVPVKDSDSLYTYMLEDLNRYSPLFGKIEKRKVRCLVAIESRKKKEMMKDSKEGPISSKNFFADLNSFLDIDYPILDETVHPRQFVPIAWKGLTLDKLKVYMEDYGIEIIESKRELNLFVLSDRPHSK